MNYIVLARRTRPQSLNELVGQDSIRDTLKSMLELNKIPHAFLFSGTRGTGKTSTARILAKSLNCEQGTTASPCQTCVNCTKITACSHEDVFEMDAASHTGVDNIRELCESTRFHPVSARYKIFIIDEIHMLSSGAFNALLKTLEEPPSNVIFILATTELHKVPITIRSRCVTLGFKKIEHLVIFEHLKKILMEEDVNFDQDALILIAREAQGSLRDALSLLEQALAIKTSHTLTVVDAKKSLGLQNSEIAFSIFLFICQQKQPEVLDVLNQADNLGLDLSLIIEQAANYFRSAVVLKSASQSNACAYLLQDERHMIQQATEHMNFASLSEVFKLLSISVKDIQRTSNKLSWAEIVVMDAINRAEWISASDLLSQIQKTTQTVQKSEPAINLIPSQSLKSQSATLQSPSSHSNEQIDLNLYKQFIATTKKRSQTLAARLNFVQLETFNRNAIKFAKTAENAIYFAFDAKDQQDFRESLEEMNLWNVMNKDTQTEEKFASLNDIREYEKKESFLQKEKEVMSRESVKNLLLITKEIQLTPVEN